MTANTTNTNTNTNTAIVVSHNVALNAMLTRSQIAAARTLESMEETTLRATAAIGRGIAAKVAKQVLGEHDVNRVIAGFIKSDCKNATQVALLIRAITGQHASSETLDACPKNLHGVLAYGSTLSAWVNSSKTDRTRNTREDVRLTVQAILDRVHSAIQASKVVEAETNHVGPAPALETTPALETVEAETNHVGPVSVLETISVLETV